MIRLDVEQGTKQWEDARVGMPTASQFDRILTPKTRKLASGAVQYRNELLAEWLLGHPIEWGDSGWVERGRELEAEARRFYEFDQDAEVEQVGLLLRDDRKVGGSPDGLVGEDGGLEIKCPAAHTHVGYLLGEGPKYIGQVQGLMYLTEREWWDVLSYCPGFPEALHRVHRDEDYISALEAALEEFLEDLDRSKEKLAPYKGDGPEAATKALAGIGATPTTEGEHG